MQEIDTCIPHPCSVSIGEITSKGCLHACSLLIYSRKVAKIIISDQYFHERIIIITLFNEGDTLQLKKLKN